MRETIKESELGTLIETLLESQAMVASFFYIELINRGLIEQPEAATRLRLLGEIVGDARQADVKMSRDLGSKLVDYAEAIAHGNGPEPRRGAKPMLRLIRGGRA
jgi:hypothetical protein